MSDPVLIVDDDPQITGFLEKFLAKHGFSTRRAETCAEAREVCARTDFCLILMDLHLPDGSGMDLLRDLRPGVTTPVIMLTGTGDTFDTVLALELGADDYMAKPYEPRELLARARMAIRRAELLREACSQAAAPAAAEQAAALVFAGLRMDLDRLDVTHMDTGADLQLTATEFSLLRCLATSAGETVSREAILTALYGSAIAITDRSIDTHVLRIRRKLEAAGLRPDLIKTVHRQGYRLTEPVRPAA